MKEKKIEEKKIKDLNSQWVPIDSVKPYYNNPRRNNKAVEAIVKSIEVYGWQWPIMVDKDMEIICGDTRYRAAREMGLEEIPIRIEKDLTPAQIKQWRIVDNRTSEIADWDKDRLTKEFEDIFKMDDAGFNDAAAVADFVGFEMEKIDKKAVRAEWDLSKVEDKYVITVTGPLEKQDEAMEILKNLDAKIEISTIKDRGQK